MLVVGIVRSSGEFNGQPFDNLNFHCYDGSKKTLAGVYTTVIKVKSSVLKEQFGDGFDVTGLLDMDVLFNFDQYGKVQNLSVM